METLEIQVKNVADAASAVAAQLGLSPDQINVTILDESPGLFGKKKLKVQVERIGEGEAAPAKGSKAKAEKPPKAEKPVKAEKPAKAEKVVEAEAEVEAETEKPERPARATRAPRGEKPAAASDNGEASEEADRPEVVATQDDADNIIAVIDEMLRLANLEAEVKVSEIQGRYVNLELDGQDVAHLVGKSGEVLNSFQYLINLICSRKFDNGVRVTLDGNSYRKRREEVLRNLATNVANEVVKRNEEAVFDALPAFERRIVHKVLSEIEGVQTYSEGEEPNRRVVVAPAN